ncbi:hypothetical protein QTP81_16005 [Alteromonas sp. ASW11-36]|uniref:VanZ-like domain-containing protein n=1 Tax=Alteromonas arenosi TaxID=3055817 RepID=A0ABT7T2X4_9ALTE|nr:hypothetical protein [Alteromonas sp. ASW11-36]MDM7862109.1 hypothetical protein [Alteromonas sp. ASW11-36]
MVLKALRSQSRRAKLIRYGLVAVCFLPLFFVRIQSVGSPFINELLDGAHIGVFFIVGWVLFPLISGHVARRSLFLLFITALASIAIEGIQDTVGRAFQWADILRNFIGMGLAITLRWRLYVSTPSDKKLAGMMFFVIVAVFVYERFALAKLVALQAYFQINAPILASFDYSFEASSWQGNYALIEYTPGKLNVFTTADRHFSGVFFRDFPMNWQGYEHLIIRLENPNASPIRVTVKITDRMHEVGVHHYDERYNGGFTLSPGSNELIIPLTEIENAPKSRLLNLGEVARIDFFLSDKAQGEQFAIDYVALQ